MATSNMGRNLSRFLHHWWLQIAIILITIGAVLANQTSLIERVDKMEDMKETVIRIDERVELIMDALNIKHRD